MSKNIIIKDAAQVVTCSGFNKKSGKEMSDLKVLEHTSILIEDGIIKRIGKSADILKDINEALYEVVDAKEKAVLPGFIDSHTHFVFGGYRAQEYSYRLRGDSYMEIMQRGGGISNTVEATRKASEEELMDLGMKRLDSMLSFGVTTIEGKSGYGLDIDTEIKQLKVMDKLNHRHPIDIEKTYLGAHAIPYEYKNRSHQYIDKIIKDILPRIVKEDLAKFCDVFCEKNVFSIQESKKLLSAAKDMGMKLKIHADEIYCLGGAELAGEVGCISADHLLMASDKGIESLAKNNVVATVLPCTAFSLKEDYARARFMIDKGCSVALATDFNPGSCFTESIPLVVALATLYMNMSIEETIIALTINAAAAIDKQDKIGSIDIGKKGDLVMLKYPDYRFIPYHIGVSTVEKVIKQGMVVFDQGRRC